MKKHNSKDSQRVYWNKKNEFLQTCQYDGGLR